MMPVMMAGMIMTKIKDWDDDDEEEDDADRGRVIEGVKRVEVPKQKQQA